MLPITPTWTGDETLYSWCCRWHRLTLNRTRSSGMALFGVPSAAKVWIAPNPLGHFAAATEGVLGPPWDILRQRTVVGSFLALARPIHTHRIQAGALSPGYLVSAKSGMGLSLRYCRTCVAQQRVVYGIPCWRIQHQLPGVAVCIEHGEPLYQCLESRQLWALPETCEANEMDVQSQPEMLGLSQAARAALHIFKAEELNVESMKDRTAKIFGEGYCALDAKHLDPKLVDADWRKSVIARWCERVHPASSAFPPMWITDLLRSRRSERSPLRWAFLVSYMHERAWITPHDFFTRRSSDSADQLSLWGTECEIPSVILHALSASTNANQASKLIGVNVVTVRKWVRTHSVLAKVVTHWDRYR